MIELLFVTCLSTSPADCQEHSLLYTDMTPMSCMMAAQPELAKWAESHPQWTISGWKCRYLNTTSKDA